MSIATASGLVGSTIYFYKRSNALQTELDKISDHLSATIKKVADMQIHGAHIEDLAKSVRELNMVAKRHNDVIKELQDITNNHTEELEEVHYTLDAIMKALKDQGIEVEHPRSYPPSRSRRPSRPKKPVSKPAGAQRETKSQRACKLRCSYTTSCP